MGIGGGLECTQRPCNPPLALERAVPQNNNSCCAAVAPGSHPLNVSMCCWLVVQPNPLLCASAPAGIDRDCDLKPQSSTTSLKPHSVAVLPAEPEDLGAHEACHRPWSAGRRTDGGEVLKPAEALTSTAGKRLRMSSGAHSGRRQAAMRVHNRCVA
jgi:hypothetical protein